jgi:hypothetical protein
MGFLDRLKQQTTEAASTVIEKGQEAAKVGQLQVQLRTLRNEEKEAYASFGREAYRLHQSGQLGASSAELAAAASAIADVEARITEKESELADVRAGDEAGEDALEAEAVEVDEATPGPGAGTATGTTGGAATGTTGGAASGTTSTTSAAETAPGGTGEEPPPAAP